MHLKRSDKFIIIILLILIFPALLINLGLLPLIEDESIRALVALEMKISGDYITPTLGGINYFNKPPLFNWIILLLYKLTNNYGEFIIRTPTIIFLLVYAYSIFYFTKDHLGNKFAIINAFSFITCGRIIFYDSMLGLIDISYSWVTYLMFNIIYIYNKKENYLLLFIYTYVLTVIGFMFKGLPALVFTGISLLVVFIADMKFRKLFSVYHLAGIVIFVLAIGTYYLIFEKINPGQLKNSFLTLFTESSKRTAIEHKFSDNIIHFFTFPFVFVYHFLPWSLLIIILFQKNTIKKIKEHPYIKFCALIFVSNIIIYWLSPNVYPRYFFMLVPLLFTILFYLFITYLNENRFVVKIIEWIFLVALVLLTVVQFAIPFEPRTREINGSILLMIVSVIIFSSIIFFYIKFKDIRLLLILLFIVVFRTEFNMLILRVREKTDPSVEYRKAAIEVGKALRDKELLLHSKATIKGFDNHKLINYQTMFYITRERMEILGRGTSDNENAYFITYDYLLKDKEYIKYFDLPIRHKKNITRVVKFKNSNNISN